MPDLKTEKQRSPRNKQLLLDYLDSSNEIYENVLGYKPESINLEILDAQQWSAFTEQYGFNANSSGIYLPRNQTAAVRLNIENAPLSLFHEYFGHGLYCEQSLAGMKLVELEKRLLDEEKAEFEEREFNLEELEEFRRTNTTAVRLRRLRKQNLGTYESFAIFSEYFLAREFGRERMFERKYDSYSKRDREGIDSIIAFNQQWGDLATFYGYGLRKIQDEKRFLQLSLEMFGKDVERFKIMTHFGSGKPFSDIDLFVISNDIQPYYGEESIDIRVQKPDEIEDNILKLDPKLTDPLFSGEFVFGDRDYFYKVRQKILSQPITEEAIKFNLRKWKYHERRSLDPLISENLRDKNLRSSNIYLANALALKQGHKLLTSQEIKNYTQKRLSPSESFIELKGGID